MDLLDEAPKFRTDDNLWSIYSRSPGLMPNYVGKNAKITNSIVAQGCRICAAVERCVISGGVTLGEGSVIRNSVVMPNVRIGKNVLINKAVIGSGAVISDNVRIGMEDINENPYKSDMCTHGIVLVGGGVTIKENNALSRGSMIEGA